MKKATLLACACALAFGAQSLMAQETAEVTYVSDPSQGYLFNRFKDNWFITAEGGANINFAKFGTERKLADRFQPAASLYVGKWFSPLLGVRVGASYMGLKNVANGTNYCGILLDEPMIDGKYYKQRTNEFGANFDVMLNVTNWWCGYKPNRVYNAIVYAGAGAFFTLEKQYNNKGEADGWHNANDKLFDLRAGIINSFNVSKQVALSLDIRYTAFDGLQNSGPAAHAKVSNLSAYVGLTYLFKKREWTAPVVPVCPEPENCDALRARLAAADARIADLEAQLKDCLNRPVETVEAPAGPLATVYYPIGVSRLSRENQRVVAAIAHVMTQNPDKKYILTGWADNYTGTDNINMRLRKNRAEGVQKVLVKNGVEASRLTVTTNNGNLSDLGEKCVALDRAVTIEEAK